MSNVMIVGVGGQGTLLASRIIGNVAIKAGYDSTDLELESFIKDLIFNNKINYCPHGRPIIIVYDKKQLEKMFKRIV